MLARIASRAVVAKRSTTQLQKARSQRRSVGTSTKDMQDFAAAHYSHGIGRVSNVVIERGQGSYVYDTDGGKYLDFTCGIAVTNTGHCHPRVVKAAQEQCGKMIHSQVGIYHQKPMLELTERLLKVLPSSLDRIFYANSGAEACENAVKIARAYTKKQNIVVMNGSFHGRTLAATAMTTSKNIYRNGFGPFPSGIVVANFPYCYRCHVKTNDATHKNDPNWCCNRCDDDLDYLFHTQTSPQDTAAIILEPILGEGGYVPATKSFMLALRKFCTENNILLIVDEVQSGFMRTGKWWGFEHYDVVPDIVVIAKGIASGFPLSAVAASTSVMKACPPGSLGGTYTGNAVACAAGVATMDVIEEENIQDNVNKRGQELVTGLKQLQMNKNYHIGEVRGKGLMIAIEFDDAAPKGVASTVTKNCLSYGMFLLTTGAHETIRIIPPLTASRSEIQDCLTILKKALDKTFNLS